MITTEQLSVSEKLAVTYGEIIKSKSVLNEVEDSLDLKCGYEELSDKVNVSSINKTQIISVSVQDTNPKRATEIANAIPTAFQQEVKRITQANDVKVIDKAVVPNKPIKPNKATIIAISAILGIMISLFIIFLLEYIRPKEGVKKNDK